MFAKIKNWLKAFRLSLRMKMTLSLSAIVIVLLMSSLISFVEFRRMSNYVSNLIAGNVNNIHVTQQMVDAVDDYNLQILTVIGDDKLNTRPNFDREAFMERCNSLKSSLGAATDLPLADSVVYAYSAYMLASLELESVLESNFIDSRDWYLTRLQPIFGRLRSYLDRLGEDEYAQLQENSARFESGVYRSVIPSATSILVGILLVFLLMFFILVFYVKPLYGMLASLRNYLEFRHRYNYEFDGNDQLWDLNNEIKELTEENRQLRKRITDLKEKSEA